MEHIIIETGNKEDKVHTPSIFDLPGVYRDNVEEFAIYDDIFDKQECKDIIAFYKAYGDKHRGKIGLGAEDEEIRNCSVYIVDEKQQIDNLSFILNKVQQVVVQANKRHFNFELTGIVEPIQFLEYDGSFSNHYCSHSDREYANITRKLSISILLSDHDEFEGGNIRFPYASDITIQSKQGSVLLFPSFTIHEVMPITKGIRHALVIWITGPSFK